MTSGDFQNTPVPGMTTVFYVQRYNAGVLVIDQAAYIRMTVYHEVTIDNTDRTDNVNHATLDICSLQCHILGAYHLTWTLSLKRTFAHLLNWEPSRPSSLYP